MSDPQSNPRVRLSDYTEAEVRAMPPGALKDWLALQAMGWEVEKDGGTFSLIAPDGSFVSGPDTPDDSHHPEWMVSRTWEAAGRALEWMASENLAPFVRQRLYGSGWVAELHLVDVIVPTIFEYAPTAPRRHRYRAHRLGAEEGGGAVTTDTRIHKDGRTRAR